MVTTINVCDLSDEGYTRTVEGVTLCINYFANCSAALDLCCTFSPLSRLYHPSSRALYVPGTPRMVCGLPLDEIAEYYQLGVYTILPQLINLPQAVFWPGDACVVSSPATGGALRTGLYVPDALPQTALPESVELLARARATFAGLTIPDSGAAQFALVIEEEVFPGFFSEVLLQAFLNRQVPVYCGDPHIKASFDTRGMIILDPIHLVDAAALINEAYYERCAAAREANYAHAMQWLDPLAGLAQDLAARSEKKRAKSLVSCGLAESQAGLSASAEDLR